MFITFGTKQRMQDLVSLKLPIK